jgi:hypothetical protein
MSFGSDLGQCWQSDLELPWGALTFPPLDLWDLCFNSTAISGGQDGGVTHGLVS